MLKFFPILFICLVYKFASINGLGCYECSGSNGKYAIEDSCLSNMGYPVKVVTREDDRRKRPCLSCYIYIINFGDRYYVIRGCTGDEKNSSSCETTDDSKKCFCNTDRCVLRFSFPCYSCQYNSGGKTITVLGKDQKSDKKCKDANSETPTAQCQGRCFQIYEKIRESNGTITESIMRGCQPSLRFHGEGWPNYSQCSVDLCNNVSLSGLNETQIITTTEASLALGIVRISGTNFGMCLVFLVVLLHLFL